MTEKNKEENVYGKVGKALGRILKKLASGDLKVETLLSTSELDEILKSMKTEHKQEEPLDISTEEIANKAEELADKVKKGEVIYNKELTDKDREEILQEAVKEKYEEFNAQEKTSERDFLKKYTTKQCMRPISQFKKEKHTNNSSEENKILSDFVNYSENTKNLIQSLVNHYKGLISLRDDSINILKEKNNILERQIGLYENIISDYETTAEDLIVHRSLPKKLELPTEEPQSLSGMLHSLWEENPKIEDPLENTFTKFQSSVKENILEKERQLKLKKDESALKNKKVTSFTRK